MTLLVLTIQIMAATTTIAAASTWEARSKVPGIIRLSVRSPSMTALPAPYHIIYSRVSSPSNLRRLVYHAMKAKPSKHQSDSYRKVG